ncbi:hypothetical protein OE88DRAFT_1651452 [Heliocybe sulcata]|uniref:Uncharacterized protein n=1 Tax=Heliocybe sulcata TaxID=5364 RepID=A0A5C3NV65_9AGAM|nr:hypothetical protein OE88DRAFT_1651452 [Heliocybe sulcata]
MERNVGRPWTAQEDALLRQAVAIHGESDNWKTIAQSVPGRTNKACRKRWRHSLSPTVKKSAWTQEEDELLLQLYAKHHTKWSLIARHIPGRTDDACSKRYREALDPALKKSEWTSEEDSVLLDLYQRLGGKWGQIGQELTRSGLACRNRWRLLERKKSHAQLSLALDPAPTVQNAATPSDGPVQSSWTNLALDVSFWDPYPTNPSSTVPLNEAGSPDIPTSHGIIPRSNPPPFQYTSSSLSSALSSPRPQLRLPRAQPFGCDQQTPQFGYEISSGQINVDCNLDVHDQHSNGVSQPELPAHNPGFLQQLHPDAQIYGLPDTYPRINADARSYGSNPIEGVQLSLGNSCAPQAPDIVYPHDAHDAHDLQPEHHGVVMQDGDPHRMSYHSGTPCSADHALSICIPATPITHEAPPMGDVCPSPYSSYTPVAQSPRPLAVIQLSPAEPDLPEQISLNLAARSRSADARRRGRSHPTAPRTQSTRRKQGDRPRKLDSDLPVSSDLSIKAYACGHPLCWLPSASASLSAFPTSHGLSEHCKERHADMNIVAVGSGGNDQPFRCGLEGCGRGWKSLNGLQYHLQVSKAHFIKAISTTSAPSSPPVTPDDETNPASAAANSSDSGSTTTVRVSANKTEKRKEHRCPHPSCPNVYKQLSGLRYHLLHAHHHGLPVQLSDVPPTLARKIKEKESKARLRASSSPDTDIHL